LKNKRLEQKKVAEEASQSASAFQLADCRLVLLESQQARGQLRVHSKPRTKTCLMIWRFCQKTKMKKHPFTSVSIHLTIILIFPLKTSISFKCRTCPTISVTKIHMEYLETVDRECTEASTLGEVDGRV
jgi:hypothetical protein